MNKQVVETSAAVPLLRVVNARKQYRLGRTLIPVLNGVDLEVKSGEWVALLGASGSGKTTLLNLIGCLERPDSGSVFIGARDYAKAREKDRVQVRKSRIGFIFQAYHLLPELTALENVALAGRLNGLSRKVSMARAEDLLRKARLDHRLRHMPNELSGGERQRAAIARALINNPELILADEPTGNLDSRSGAALLELFQNIRHNNRDVALLMVTHAREVAAAADRVIEIKDGVIINVSDRTH